MAAKFAMKGNNSRHGNLYRMQRFLQTFPKPVMDIDSLAVYEKYLWNPEYLSYKSKCRLRGENIGKHAFSKYNKPLRPRDEYLSEQYLKLILKF